MSEHFIRCPHCSSPHEIDRRSCPTTGKPLEFATRRTSVPPAPPSTRWQLEVDYESPVSVDALPVEQYLGTVVDGKYHITRLLGRGGMGAVYEALDMSLDKAVALKVVLRGHRPGSRDAERLYREARIVSSIGHPNIVDVFDLGALECGAPYLAMELLEGETLLARLRHDGPLALRDFFDVIEPVLSALGAAHSKNIIHRDLKPENVFLRAGRGTAVKLLDFGVSKGLVDQDSATLTDTGIVLGTPFYLSPEQAWGDLDVDARADVWACGVLMYECLTGRIPFSADNYNALLLSIITTRPTPPSKVRPALPSGLEEIVLKALARDREERFQSCAGLLEALQRVRAAADETEWAASGVRTCDDDTDRSLVPRPGDHLVRFDDSTEITDFGAVASPAARSKKPR